MNGFKQIGAYVGKDVKLNTDPFKDGKHLEFEKDTFKVGLDVDEGTPILQQIQQQKEEIAETKEEKREDMVERILSEIVEEIKEDEKKQMENKNGEKPSGVVSVIESNKQNIQMREVAYDEETGVSTILIEKFDENGKKRTYLAGTKNFGKTQKQRTADVSCQDGLRTEDTSSTTQECGNDKTQRERNTEGMMKALQDDTVDFARSSEVSRDCKTSEKDQKSEKVAEGLSARQKCEEEVESEWKKLEMM